MHSYTDDFRTKELDLRDGHIVHFKERVPNLASLKTVFTHAFETKCRRLSTSWDFHLEYYQVTEERCLSFSISFRRVDSRRKMVRAKIKVQLYNNLYTPIYSLQEFSNDEMWSGGVLEDVVHGNKPEYIDVQSEEVIVYVIMEIYDCHSHSDYRDITK